MAVQNLRRNIAYGLSDPLLNVFPAPIVSDRSPTGNDKAQIGQTWVNSATDQVYTLSSIVNNVANWAVSAVGGGGLTTANADVGAATTIADAMTFAGGSNINTSAAAHTVTFNLNNSIAVIGSITAGTAITAGTTITATAGNINATIGNINAGGLLTAGTGLEVFSFGVGVVQSDGAGVLSSTTGSNGQILIGGGAAPIWNTLTAGTNITITNAANSITISAATGALNLNYTPVNVSPYVVLGTDDYIGVDSSGGAITVELPNAPATGRAFIIKDSTGSSATHNITVTTVGGIVTIDGATSVVFSTNFQSIQVIFNGTDYEVY